MNKKIIQQAFDNLSSLSQDKFNDLLDKSRNGDISYDLKYSGAIDIIYSELNNNYDNDIVNLLINNAGSLI